MSLLFDPVSQEEFELVRTHFTEKAEALRDKTKKPFAWVSYDQSKYSKIEIGGRTYIIAAGNVFAVIINDVLPRATVLYPDSFGKQDPIKVLKAVYDSEPWSTFDKFDTFLSLETFAFIFEITESQIINDRVLRVDLFRLINRKKKGKIMPEFTGGVFHAFKHFNYKGIPLSTGPGEIQLDHPKDIITVLIDCFFRSPPEYKPDGFTSRTDLAGKKEIKASFYEEQGTGVYFIQTVHPC